MTALVFKEPGVLARALVADRPFGDSDYIQAQLYAAYARRLGRISELLPAAGELAGALARADEATRWQTLGDPAIRAVTQQALTQIVTGTQEGFPLAECAEAFREAAGHLDAAAGPLQAGSPSLGPAWIWSEDRADDVFTRAFRHVIARDFDGPLCSAGERDVQALHDAAQVIEQVSPELARSALSHVRLVALFPQEGRWENVSSCSQFRVGGVVFLAQSKLDDPWYVAEHLLHEALHQKLYDIRHAHSVLRRDFDPDRSDQELPKVVSLWNSEEVPGSNRWGPSRTLAAFHVYVHLAVYARLAEFSGIHDGRLVSSASAFRRALYLGEQLHQHYEDELGLAGRCLWDWLTQCLALFAPAPSGLRTAFLLERYEQGAQILAARDGADDVGEELRSAREALRACGASALSEELERRLPPELGGAELAGSGGGAPGDRPGKAVSALAVRQAIGWVLGEALDQGSLEAVPAALGVVEALVERAGAQLRYPAPAGSARDERAELLALTDVIGEVFGTEDFGLFLYSIVRMHAPRTIVELGTGLGTSALWMALAAKRNGVGRVWTVDDGSLAEGYAGIIRSRLAGTVWEGLAGPDWLVEVRRILGLEEQLSFVRRRIDPGDFEGYPFVPPVDLLFSDFNHGPYAILQILGQFLPRMAESSSIFIDGASTAWSSYLLLEHLVEQLNRGAVPALLRQLSPGLVMENRRIVLVHLTERKDRTQNSTAWLKLEPVDLQPHPLASMRGL